MSLGTWNNIGATFVVISLTLTVLGFSTDQWIRFSVDTPTFSTLSTADQNQAVLFGVNDDRNRGLLKQCYASKPGYLDSSSKKASSSCAWVEYEIPASNQYSSGSGDYKSMIDWQRLAPISLCLAMTLLLITLVCHVFSGCCYAERKIAMTAGVLLIFTLLCIAAGITGFLVAFLEYEKKNVKDSWFYWAAWPQQLKSATSYSFGWSFYVVIAAWPCTLIAAVLFFVDYRSRDDYGNEISSKKRTRLMSPYNNGYPTQPADGYHTGGYPNGGYPTNGYPTNQHASDTGRVIKQQINPRTFDHVSGREVGPQLKSGYDYDQDSYHQAPRGRSRQSRGDYYKGRNYNASPTRDRRGYDGRSNDYYYY